MKIDDNNTENAAVAASSGDPIIMLKSPSVPKMLLPVKDSSHIIELPEHSAAKTAFPPGIRVMMMPMIPSPQDDNAADETSSANASFGTHRHAVVTHGGVDLSTPNRASVYQIQCVGGANNLLVESTTAAPCWIQEEDLQFAPLTPAWLEFGNNPTKKKRVIVLYSEQSIIIDQENSTLYTVQDVDSHAIYRTIAPSRLSHRSRSTTADLVLQTPISKQTMDTKRSPKQEGFIERCRTVTPTNDDKSETNSSSTSTAAAEQAKERGVNLYPNHFSTVARGRRHDFAAAIRLVRADLRRKAPLTYNSHDAFWGMGPVLAKRCMEWHLVGTCRRNQNCIWKGDHIPLTLQQTQELEQALAPAIFPGGPIRTMNNNIDMHNKKKRDHESGQQPYHHERSSFNDDESTTNTTKKQRLTMAMPTTNHDSSASASPVNGKVPSPSDTTTSPFTIRLPSEILTLSHLKSVLLGRNGHRASSLCRQHHVLCLRINGTLLNDDPRFPKYTGKEELVVQFLPIQKSSIPPDYEACYLGMEDILLHFCPDKHVRVALLFYLAMENDLVCRPKRDGILVQSRNPFFSKDGNHNNDNSSQQQQHWMTLVQVGETTQPHLSVVGIQDAQSKLRHLRNAYPTCHVGLVLESAAFPKLTPHVYVSGLDYSSVLNCREELLSSVGDAFVGAVL